MAAALFITGALHLQAQQYQWTNFAGSPGVTGTANGTGAAARFNSPGGLAVDGSGNIYVADGRNDTVRRITPGGAVTTFAGIPGVSGLMNGSGASVEFNAPGGVAVDGTGNVYVADSGNLVIRKVTGAGVATILAGDPLTVGTADGQGTAAQFGLPAGLAVDGTGNVYVADLGSDTIRKITPGGFVTTLAGTPRVSGTADGTGGAALFNDPSALAVDGSGNLYVADGANTIRKIAPGGMVTTLAGTPGVSGTADGTGGAAQFDDPTGVAVDHNGNIYVADSSNHTIRKVTPGGVVTTIGGTAGAFGSQAGIGPLAQFTNLGGIALSGTGLVYVADQTPNNRIALGTLIPYTIPPTLSAPTANSTVTSPVAVSYTLPAPALAGSVQLTFDNGSGTLRVLTLAGAAETSFTFDPANPLASSGVTGISGGSVIPLGNYTVSLSYQDLEGDPAASVSATNVTLSAVMTDNASSVNSFSATLAGSVSGDYSPASISNTYFEWGTSTAYGNTVPATLPAPPWLATIGSGTNATPLARDTTYHYQFVGTLNGTAYYGGDHTFTTSHDDPPTTQPAYFYLRSKPAPSITLDVLANDTLVNPLDTLTVTAFSQPAGGNLQITGNGTTLLYTPTSRYSGHDSFTYTVSDGFGGTAAGIVYIMNPFLDYAGNFQTLLSGSVPGYLTVTLGARGSFTGSLKTLGAAYAFTGALTPVDPLDTALVTGTAAVTIRRGALPALTLDLTLDASTGELGYTLTETGGAPVSGFFTEKVLYSSINPAPEAGRYTIIIPATSSTNQAASSVPQGTGWATMSVGTAGAVSITGVLGDGTPFTAGSWLDNSPAISGNPYAGSTQTFPVYSNVYTAPAGYIHGTMTFEDEPGVSDFDGALSWYKPPQTATGIYPNGFNVSVTMLGSAYVEPQPGYVLNLQHIKGNALLTVSGGGIGSTLQDTVTIAQAPSTTVTVVSTSAGTLTVASKPSIGAFDGKFNPTSGGSKGRGGSSSTGTATKYGGVYFQKQNLGAGEFIGTSASGSVNITPQ